MWFKAWNSSSPSLAKSIFYCKRILSAIPTSWYTSIKHRYISLEVLIFPTKNKLIYVFPRIHNLPPLTRSLSLTLFHVPSSSGTILALTCLGTNLPATSQNSHRGFRQCSLRLPVDDSDKCLLVIEIWRWAVTIMWSILYKLRYRAL